MKVLVNRRYGGFSLSDQAIEECIKRGMTVSTDWHDGTDFVKNKHTKPILGKYYTVNYNEKTFRTHPVVIAVVEELRELAKKKSDEKRPLKTTSASFVRRKRPLPPLFARFLSSVLSYQESGGFESNLPTQFLAPLFHRECRNDMGGFGGLPPSSSATANIATCLGVNAA